MSYGVRGHDLAGLAAIVPRSALQLVYAYPSEGPASGSAATHVNSFKSLSLAIRGVLDSICGEKASQPRTYESTACLTYDTQVPVLIGQHVNSFPGGPDVPISSAVMTCQWRAECGPCLLCSRLFPSDQGGAAGGQGGQWPAGAGVSTPAGAPAHCCSLSQRRWRPARHTPCMPTGALPRWVQAHREPLPRAQAHFLADCGPGRGQGDAFMELSHLALSPPMRFVSKSSSRNVPPSRLPPRSPACCWWRSAAAAWPPWRPTSWWCSWRRPWCCS